MTEADRIPRSKSYWLLVRNGRGQTEVLSTSLSGGQQALPVFSFEEEAKMFLCLRDSQDGWRVEETAAEELLSMLDTDLSAGCVTLDPIPEDSCLNSTGILSISQKDFMERLRRTTVRNDLAGKRFLRPTAYGEG